MKKQKPLNPKIWSSHAEFEYFGKLFLDLYTQFGRIKLADMMTIDSDITQSQWSSLAALHDSGSNKLKDLKNYNIFDAINVKNKQLTP